MTAHTEFVALMAGVFVILLLASAVGAALQHRFNRDRSNAVIENLNARITAWWAMVALLGLALLAGRIGGADPFCGPLLRGAA
jgi:phosphatidate cytidylyltransferase